MLKKQATVNFVGVHRILLMAPKYEAVTQKQQPIQQRVWNFYALYVFRAAQPSFFMYTNKFCILTTLRRASK